MSKPAIISGIVMTFIMKANGQEKIPSMIPPRLNSKKCPKKGNI